MLRRSVNVGSASAAVGEQVEEVPLRDHGDVGVGDATREAPEVADHQALPVADRERDLLHPALRQGVEALAQAELVEQVERRRVDGVAAEVPQEVRVLLEHGDLDPGTGQQQPEHHPRRAAPDHAARRALHGPHPISPDLNAC